MHGDAPLEEIQLSGTGDYDLLLLSLFLSVLLLLLLLFFIIIIIIVVVVVVMTTEIISITSVCKRVGPRLLTSPSNEDRNNIQFCVLFPLEFEFQNQSATG